MDPAFHAGFSLFAAVLEGSLQLFGQTGHKGPRYTDFISSGGKTDRQKLNRDL